MDGLKEARQPQVRGIGEGEVPSPCSTPMVSRIEEEGQDMIFFRDGKPGYRFLPAPPSKLKRRA